MKVIAVTLLAETFSIFWHLIQKLFLQALHFYGGYEHSCVEKMCYFVTVWYSLRLLKVDDQTHICVIIFWIIRFLVFGNSRTLLPADDSDNNLPFSKKSINSTNIDISWTRIFHSFDGIIRYFHLAAIKVVDILLIYCNYS